MSSYTTNSAKETKEVAKNILPLLKPKDILCLEGDLGTGKTSFSQGLLEALGAQKPYTSPTFLIIKEYTLEQKHSSGIDTIYHIDAYRIVSKDLLEQGWNDIITNPTALTLIEWPERITEIIPSYATTLSFAWESERERIITIPDISPTDNAPTTDDPKKSPFL